MNSIRKIAPIGAIALLLATPAAAEDCKPLTLIASIDLVPTTDNGAPVIRAVVGGKLKKLIIDTGGVYSTITPAFADELNLAHSHGPVELVDTAGRRSDAYVRTSLQIGDAKADRVAFMLMQLDAVANDPEIVGKLSPDMLHNFDVEFDVTGGKINLMSPDHCQGKVIYWPAEVAAVVPMNYKNDGHVEIPVLLDGKKQYALIDTGSSNSTISLAEARFTYDVKPGSEDTPNIGNLPGHPNDRIYRHTFHSLEFEGVAVANPSLSLIPDLERNVVTSNATQATGTHVVAPEDDETKQTIALGMDILRHFHIYIAYKEKLVYLTPATAPAAH